ncbi:MAG: hypothetical protein NT062_32010 [Proteobacteria bacterium]|nr:hypothetical protein [Pseudomonadota bacterium]
MLQVLVVAMVSVGVLGGCVEGNAVRCGEAHDTLCPRDTACDEAHHLCVAPDQLASCVGLDANAPCMTTTITDGHCTDGVCLPSICGDLIVEFGEVCDDGNTSEGKGDTCAADCRSDRACGNGVVDLSMGEQCDDGEADPTITLDRRDHDGCSSTCQLEQPRWFRHTPEPGVRVGAASAYDPAHDRLLIFGGGPDFSATTADTLAWNGIDWVTLAPTIHPTPRQFARAASHGTNQIVLFGGRSTNGITFGDTWTWDGTTWTATDVVGPPARSAHVMVYDPRRKVIVVFGGNSGNGILDDTWEWDGVAWTEVITAVHPSKRELAAATYDPVRQKIVLVGGREGPTLTDTWTYDGTWEDVTTTPAPLVVGAGLAFDDVGQRVLLFGGFDTSDLGTSGTWAWSGTAWTALAATAATPRGHVVLVASCCSVAPQRSMPGLRSEIRACSPPPAMRGNCR